MVGQRRPSRSCSILIWGGFLLLYAALTAIIDCTQSNGTSTTVIPLSSSVKQSSSADLVTTDDTYASGDGQTILPTQSLLQNENQTTESISVSIFIITIILQLLDRYLKVKNVSFLATLTYFNLCSWLSIR